MNQVPQSDLANLNNPGDSSWSKPNFFRLFPQFNSILAHDFSGWSNYDALQLRLLKRLSRGVSYQFNYAWSKTMDTGTSSGHDQGLDGWQIARDPRANYALSQLDATHNFNGSISYDLPFGEGRMFPVHGVLNQIVGGWRVNTVIQARSGVPFTPVISENFNGNDPAHSGSYNCFCSYWLLPNRNGSGKLSNPTISQWFDPTAFTDPTAGGTTPAFGNSGRDILRGPKFVNFDLSLGKSFRIREGMNFEFRADAYDVFNHPDFGLPDANVAPSNTNAGKISNTTNFGGPDRIFQFGGRFTF